MDIGRPRVRTAVRGWVARRRRDAVDATPGGLFVLVVALVVPAQRALEQPLGRAISELAVLAVFAGVFILGQALDVTASAPLRALVLIVMTAVSTWGLVDAGSEWVVASAMAAASCANLFPLVAWASAGVIVVAACATVGAGQGSAGLVVAGAGAIAVLRGRLIEEIARTRSQRRALAEAAVDNERLRIAQDLHDLLGHSLVSMVMKAELAERLTGIDPAAAAAAARDVQVVGREAMGEVHAAVAGVRARSLSVELARSADAFAPGVVLDVTVADRQWTDDVDDLLAWTVREATTNALRHADASRCTCTIVVADGLVRLTMTNDGVGTRAHAVRGGNGLSGLRDRAAALGGTVRSDPLPADRTYTIEVSVRADARHTRGGTDEG